MHFLDLPKAALLRTPYWVVGREAMLDTARLRAIASITGPPGTGKSFLLASVAPDLGLPITRVEFDHRPTMLSISRQLLAKLTPEVPANNKHQLIGPLVDALRRPRAVLVDEAQRLNRETLDHLRFLHDHRETSFALILAGGQGCWEVLGREPQLRRRIFRPVFFRPLTPKEVLVLIPRLHPVWKRVSTQQISHIDQEFASGVLGHWASITLTMLDLVPGQATVDDQLIDAALVKHGVLDSSSGPPVG